MADRRLAVGSPGWKTAFEERLQGRARLGNFGVSHAESATIPRFVENNHAFYVRDGRLQREWMLAAIESARERVDLEMYIFEPDETGTRIRDALVAAAKRGVVVRLMFDSIGSVRGGPAFFQPIVDAGGRVVEFNPAAPWRLRMSRIGKMQIWQPNRRDHRKLLVCDAPLSWVRGAMPRDGDRPAPPNPEDDAPGADRAAIAITGGRNIADNYLGMTIGEGQWRDCGVVLFGPVVVELGAIFDAMWFHAEGPEITPPALRRRDVGDLSILPIGTQPGLFNPLQWALSRLALAVRRELRISCAYFIPSVRLRRALATVARRTKRCLVLLPKASDVPMVDRASRHLWGALLKAGIQLFRYAETILHEKTVVYDGVVTVVGSSNLDPRSFRLNYELSVIVIGASFAAPVVEAHEADLARAEPYTLAEWRARPFFQKLGDWMWSLVRSQL